MLTARQHWGAIIGANAAGATLVFIGADASTAVQILGYLLLVPGSIVAAALPLHRLWHPSLWRCCQTDAAGLSNILYLPVAVVINLLMWWCVRLYWSKRSAAKLLKW
jgi:hypothetical protein